MNPKYSILYFNQILPEHYHEILRQLYSGIKVFWFGTDQDVRQLKDAFPKYISAFFLQVFSMDEIKTKGLPSSIIIVDGEGIFSDNHKIELISFLENAIPAFNAAQYKVEHCMANQNIVVKASAGTGKTTVMIDRILYLMHTVPNLDMSEIYMITFTNEATNQMNDRLQDMLLKKYSLTKNKRYLTWLEQQSQMHISTIDSLAYDLFRKYGTGAGFGRDLAIAPLEKERRDMIKDLLSDTLDATRNIANQIGMSYSEAAKIIDGYWKELTRKGFTISEVLALDWGKTTDYPAIATFQHTLKEVLKHFEERYRQLKLNANAISINDLFFDFGHYLLDNRINCDGLNMKYLFVDEFQDTDATQIRTFARLVKTIGSRLFAVGDIKQSIYSFKGATDEAFAILDKEMHGTLTYFDLINNYRTCSNLMKVMEHYFHAWSDAGLLNYDKPVRPFNREQGTAIMDFAEKDSDSYHTQLLSELDEALEELELDIKSGRKKISDKSKVAILVRGNKKAAELAKLCRENGITVVLSSDKPFFLSEAVRDFYAMISSYLFAEQPIYIYNYLMTPYAAFDTVVSIEELEKQKGDAHSLRQQLNTYLQRTSWHKYQRDFRLKPILSVIKEIIENEHLIENYIAADKLHMYGDNLTEAKKNQQALIDAKVYQANLDKLMELIQQRMDGEFATLYDLYSYLKLMISTNREEMEPELTVTDDYTSVYIMTVHKSKGLEFDTVIMPAMSGSLVPQERTAILFNKENAAWYYKGEAAGSMHSEWYQKLRLEAVKKSEAEETRMLYVAMTRAVNKLVLLVNTNDNYTSWSSLIRKAGLINE